MVIYIFFDFLSHTIFSYITNHIHSLLSHSSLSYPPPPPPPLSTHTHTHTCSKEAGEEAERNLQEFVCDLMDSCVESVKEKLGREAYHLDSMQLVRALDKLSGKMEAVDQLMLSAQLKTLVSTHGNPEILALYTYTM